MNNYKQYPTTTHKPETTHTRDNVSPYDQNNYKQ